MESKSWRSEKVAVCDEAWLIQQVIKNCVENLVDLEVGCDL